MTDYDALVIEARNFPAARSFGHPGVKLIGRLANAVADLAAVLAAVRALPVYADDRFPVVDLYELQAALGFPLSDAPLAPVSALDAGSAPERAPLDPYPWIVFADEGGIVLRGATRSNAARWCMGGESIEFAPADGFEKDPAAYGARGEGA